MKCIVLLLLVFPNYFFKRLIIRKIMPRNSTGEVIVLKKINISKNVLTAIVATGIVILGLLGASWKVGLAGTAPTTPTIPIVTTITPASFCVGSGDVNATITGSNFINYEGTYYTSISWLGPGDTSPSTIEPEYISLDGKTLRFWVEAFRLTEAGTALVVVVNHPELETPFELATFNMKINHCIYLPLIMK